jgi:hypothetical protein
MDTLQKNHRNLNKWKNAVIMQLNNVDHDHQSEITQNYINFITDILSLSIHENGIFY